MNMKEKRLGKVRKNNIPENNNEEIIEVNQEAQEVINKSLEREARCKKKVLQDVLNVVNNVCEQNNLQYFAIGELLTQCMYGVDSYPNTKTYFIGLLRKDFDTLFEKIALQEKETDIRVRSAYSKNKAIGRIHFYICKREVFHDEMGTLDIKIRLRVEPYEYLPTEYQEQQSFVREVAKMTREYRAFSQYYKKKAQGKSSSIFGKIKQKLDRRQMTKVFVEKNKIYRQFLSKYKDMNDPVYAGRIELLIYAPHKLKEIFPIQKKSFLDTELMIPAQPEKFAVYLKEEEDARLVNGRLETLKAFDELCQKNNIQYFVMNKLAIACTHYQDYYSGMERAQWCIGILRDDYDRVITLFNQEKQTEGLILKRTIEEYPLIHGAQEVVLLKKFAKRNPGEHDYPIHLLPMDALPDNYDEAVQFRKEVKEAEDQLQELIDIEKGIIYVKKQPPINTWKKFEENQLLRRKYNQRNRSPKRVFTVSDNRIKVYSVNELFPVERKPFHDFSVLCAKNPFLWREKNDEAFTEYLANERTKILKIIDDLCAKNGLAYFAIANLLIGAVVYHDVMPKSNARRMDIAFLRKDYERFLKILREQAADYGLQLNEYMDSERKYPLMTKYISFIEGEYSDIKIMILPFDKVPEDFYLYTGFRNDMNQRNQDYEELRSYYTHSKTEKEFAELEEEEQTRSEYLQALNPLEEAQKLDQFAQSFNDDERSHAYARVAFGRSKVITEEELFPLQRVKFRDMMINCPKDYSVWQPVLNSELERQVVSIQKADLLIVEEFDKICRKLNIGYFICGGTMLGYMRHEGFIPWDDDVDVAMLRADYDRFLAEAGPLLPEGFFLQTRQTDPNIPYLFSKIRLDGTEYITKYNEKRDFHKGICLDIFPFDYLPDNETERKEFIEEVKELAVEHNKIANQQYPEPEEPCIPRNELEEKYYKEQEEIRRYYWSQSLADSQKAYLDAATRYNDKAEKLGLHTVASFVPSYTFIDISDLLPYQRGMFEGIEVSVPKRPDVFLKMQYGNFMELPPKHMQVAHRLLRWSTWEASWDNPPEKNEDIEEKE